MFTTSNTSSDSECVRVCVGGGDDRVAAFSRTARDSAWKLTGWHANGRQVNTAFKFKTLHSG